MKVFLGRVVENKYYPKTGYIDVMLPQEEEEMGGEDFFINEFKNKEIPDMLPSYSEGLRGDGITHRCSVLSPLGTGANYGAAHIPQINSVGLVMQLEGGNMPSWTSDDCYIWLGGLYGTKLYGKYRSLPMDDTLSEDLKNIDEELVADDDGTDDITGSGYVEEGMMLVKLKTSRTAGDYLNADDMAEKHIHYSTTPTENTIVFRKTKAGFRHNAYDNEDKRILIADITFTKDYSKIFRYKNDENNDDERTEQIQVFNDEKVELQFLNKKTKIDRTLTFDDDKIQLQFSDPEGKKNHVLEFNNTDKKMTLDFKNDDSQKDHYLIFEDSKITLKMDNNGEGKDVTLSFDDTGQLKLHTSAEIIAHSEGDVSISIDKSCDVTVKDDITVKANNITSTSNSATIDSAMTEIKGGQLKTQYPTVIPDKKGPYCCLPLCPILMIPHTGSIASG